MALWGCWGLRVVSWGEAEEAGAAEAREGDVCVCASTWWQQCPTAVGVGSESKEAADWGGCLRKAQWVICWLQLQRGPWGLQPQVPIPAGICCLVPTFSFCYWTKVRAPSMPETEVGWKLRYFFRHIDDALLNGFAYSSVAMRPWHSFMGTQFLCSRSAVGLSLCWAGPATILLLQPKALKALLCGWVVGLLLVLFGVCCLS